MTAARRLYLFVPATGDQAAGGAFAAELGAALRACAGTAAVLLRLPLADDGSLKDIAAGFAPIVQGAGAALLLDGHPNLVAPVGADGAHLAGPEALTAALPQLKPQYIAGAGQLLTRHDAMVAAEAGADYVMFGEPGSTGRRPSFSAIRERVTWWAELSEIPCVAYAAELDQIAELAAAGADFVAVDDALFNDPRGLEAATADAVARLALAEAA
jgi:thiamine-phosphate pyrophosphorylase